MNNVKVGSVVKATDTVIDDGVIHARPGDIGRVEGVELDGELIALTVAYENAPCATTSFLGEDCELATA